MKAVFGVTSEPLTASARELFTPFPLAALDDRNLLQTALSFYRNKCTKQQFIHLLTAAFQ